MTAAVKPIQIEDHRRGRQEQATERGENFSQIPHSFDQLVKEAATLAEVKVLWVIARQTYGYHKTSDRISLTRFEELTGLCRQSVIAGIEAGVSRGIITRLGGKNRGYHYRLNMPGSLQDRLQDNDPQQSTDHTASSLQDRPPAVYDVDTQNKTYKQNNLKKRITEGGRYESSTNKPNSFRSTVLPQSLINFIEDLTNYDLQEPHNFNSNVTTFGSLYKQYNLSQDEFIAVMYQTRAALKASANVRNKGAWYTRKLTTTLEQIDKAQQNRLPTDFDTNAPAQPPATSPAALPERTVPDHEQPAPRPTGQPTTGDSGRTKRSALPTDGRATQASRPGGTPPAGAAKPVSVWRPARPDQGTDQQQEPPQPGQAGYKIDFSKYKPGGKYGYLAAGH